MAKIKALENFNPYKKKCLKCDYETDNILDFLTHLRNVHNYEILLIKDFTDLLPP